MCYLHIHIILQCFHLVEWQKCLAKFKIVHNVRWYIIYGITSSAGNNQRLNLMILYSNIWTFTLVALVSRCFKSIGRHIIHQRYRKFILQETSYQETLKVDSFRNFVRPDEIECMWQSAKKMEYEKEPGTKCSARK